MRMIGCKKHEEKFVLPTEEEEFLSGKYHQDVEQCHLHHESYPNCRFEEVLE